MNPLVIFPGHSISLPPRYYGSVGYYAVAAVFESAAVDYGRLFDKRRKEAHRCDIADKQGTAQLTAAIAKPHGIVCATWRDVRLSDHGAWWHIHRNTLATAYGRTPFFEFYIDRFEPYLSPEVMHLYPTLPQLLTAIDATLRDCLGIDPDPGSIPESAIPFEKATAGLTPDDLPDYWQVRADTLGFIAGLSALDLLFNLGPEAPLYLRSAGAALAPRIASTL